MAISLPLEKWRFFLERHLQPSLMEALGMSRDFVRNGLHDDWKRWWNEQLAPAVKALNNIQERYGVSLVRRATFGDVKKLVAPGTVRLLFLMAHHPSGTSEIELYDGLLPWDKFAPVIAGITSVLLVCGSEDWMRQLMDLRSLPAGSILQEMPVREGCEYLPYLLEQVTGGVSLEEAQHRAKERFLNR